MTCDRECGFNRVSGLGGSSSSEPDFGTGDTKVQLRENKNGAAFSVAMEHRESELQEEQ
jgi:hypothetical protein